MLTAFRYPGDSNLCFLARIEIETVLNTYQDVPWPVERNNKRAVASAHLMSGARLWDDSGAGQ